LIDSCVRTNLVGKGIYRHRLKNRFTFHW
jgi:hypothetical protein